MSKRVWGLVAVLLLLGCAPASAGVLDAAVAQYIYEVLLDIDNNPATGGPVTVVQDTEVPHDVVGIDYIVRVGAILGPTVATRDVLRWNADTMTFDLIDCNPTPYPIGVTMDGGEMVEFGALLSLLGNPQGTIRGVFHASQVQRHNDYTSPFLLRIPVKAPAQSMAGLALLALFLFASATYMLRARRGSSVAGMLLATSLAVASIVWASGLVIDGNFGDWAGIPSIVTDVSGDSSIHDPAEDILAGFAVIQGNTVFFRMDLAGVIGPAPC